MHYEYDTAAQIPTYIKYMITNRMIYDTYAVLPLKHAKNVQTCKKCTLNKITK